MNRTRQSHLPWRNIILLSAVLGEMLFSGCQESIGPKHSSAPQRDINAVLADHDNQLLAMPGVVGVYVGLLDDQKTLCLKVMLARKDRSLEASIPRLLEGYPVITEITGEIRPLSR